MALCALLSGHLSAQAVEIVAAIHYSSEYTTNTLLTDDNEIGEWIHAPGVNLVAQHDSAALALDVGYDYIRRIYQKDIFQDENVLTGVSTARWYALPQRLDFFVSNFRTESTVRARQAETQANRQVISDTRAGSTLRFRPRGADELQFEYSFHDINANQTRTDSKRHNATARYLVGLSANRGLQMETTYSNIEYEGLFPDAQFLIASIGYSQTSRMLDLDINVGYNWYDREERGGTGDPTYQAALTWRPTPTATLAANAFHGIVDQSTSLDGTGSAVENTGINAAFVETRGDLDLSQSFGRTLLTIGGYWVQEEYANDVPLDNSRIGGRVALSRNLTRRTSLTITGDYSNRDFRDQGDEQDEVRADLRASHRINRSLELSGTVSFQKRAAQTSRSYEEWRSGLALYYTFWGASR